MEKNTKKVYFSRKYLIFLAFHVYCRLALRTDDTEKVQAVLHTTCFHTYFHGQWVVNNHKAIYIVHILIIMMVVNIVKSWVLLQKSTPS